MKYILFTFLLSSSIAYSQVDPMDPYKNEDPAKMEINKGTLRLLLTIAAEPSLSITPAYEHVIIQPFTFVIKGGPVLEKESERVAGKAMLSGELRYFFNLFRRIRLERTVRNFSGGYIGIEQTAVTPSVYIIKSDYHEDSRGYFGSYLNIGFQKQYRKSYFGAYLGVLFTGESSGLHEYGSDVLHAGIHLGIIL